MISASLRGNAAKNRNFSQPVPLNTTQRAPIDGKLSPRVLLRAGCEMPSKRGDRAPNRVSPRPGIAALLPSGFRHLPLYDAPDVRPPCASDPTSLTFPCSSRLPDQEAYAMHTTIALFNHKGGVSKTTTTFNLGWRLAQLGNRVVMIDTDPQCNLTGLVLDYQHADLDEFYRKHPNQNIRSGLAPAFESQPRRIEAIECVQLQKCNNLFLVPGHVNLSEYEVTLGIAQELSGSIQALRNLPGAFHYLHSHIAERYSADFLLIDMNPSLGAINQNLLTTSDYFIVPVAPDYFSLMAIDSLANVLPKWINWAKKAHDVELLRDAEYPFPEPKVKFLGTVIQKYRPRKGKATEGFQSWIDDINRRVIDTLVPTLRRAGATLSDQQYAAAGLDPADGYCLAQVPDFNTLIATSQKYQTPVFALEDEMFGHLGKVLEQDKEKRNEFLAIFDQLAARVVSLTK